MHKWSAAKKDETLGDLDRREHSKMVKLNMKQLEVREELASLQKSKNKTFQNHLLRGLTKPEGITVSKSDSNLHGLFGDLSRSTSLGNRASSKTNSDVFPIKSRSGTPERRKHDL